MTPSAIAHAPLSHSPGGTVPPGALRVWIVGAGEPIAGLDAGARPHRYRVLADALVDRGHSVVWWNSTFQHLTKSYRFQEPTAVELRPGLTLRLLHARPGYRRNVSVARWLYHRALARQFARAVSDASPPDVIVACLPSPELCASAVRFGRRANVPVIVDVQDPWPDIYLSVLPPALHGVARTLLSHEYRRLRRMIGDASGITAVSREYLEWTLAHGRVAGGKNHRVFALGHEPGVVTAERSIAHGAAVRARYGIPADARLVVFSGSFGRSYDLDTIVDCASMMHDEGRADVQFVLAGDGDKAPHIRKRAARLPNLTMTGWLDQTSLADLIGSASLGLCAYAPRATQQLPYKAFEYMAAGLPQISSLPGELAELIRVHEIGGQYDAGVARSLKDAILSFFSLPQASRDQMGRNARALFSLRFDATQIYPQMAAFVESFALAPASLVEPDRLRHETRHPRPLFVESDPAPAGPV